MNLYEGATVWIRGHDGRALMFAVIEGLHAGRNADRVLVRVDPMGPEDDGLREVAFDDIGGLIMC